MKTRKKSLFPELWLAGSTRYPSKPAKPCRESQGSKVERKEEKACFMHTQESTLIDPPMQMQCVESLKPKRTEETCPDATCAGKIYIIELESVLRREENADPVMEPNKSEVAEGLLAHSQGLEFPRISTWYAGMYAGVVAPGMRRDGVSESKRRPGRWIWEITIAGCSAAWHASLADGRVTVPSLFSDPRHPRCRGE